MENEEEFACEPTVVVACFDVNTLAIITLITYCNQWLGHAHTHAPLPTHTLLTVCISHVLMVGINSVPALLNVVGLRISG